MVARASVSLSGGLLASLSFDLVTPPLKNVRKRRFRKVARQKTQDHDETEKEVRRLFR